MFFLLYFFYLKFIIPVICPQGSCAADLIVQARAAQPGQLQLELVGCRELAHVLVCVFIYVIHMHRDVMLTRQFTLAKIFI